MIFAKYPDKIFNDIRYFTIFVGHDRSGHSSAYAVLDAQPNIVLSHELDVPQYLKKYKFNKNKVFKLMIAKSNDNLRRKIFYYDYSIPGQYRGHFKKLHVIGDKCAEKTTLYLHDHPKMLAALFKHFGHSLKIVNVVRNPYDNISAYVTRRGISVDSAINRYFKVVNIVTKLKNKIPPDQFRTVYHEDFVTDKEKEITSLCSFLGEKVSPDSLKACSEMIYDSPHKRRHSFDWRQKDKRKIESGIKRYSPLLGHYKF